MGKSKHMPLSFPAQQRQREPKGSKGNSNSFHNVDVYHRSLEQDTELQKPGEEEAERLLSNNPTRAGLPADITAKQAHPRYIRWLQESPGPFLMRSV